MHLQEVVVSQFVDTYQVGHKVDDWSVIPFNDDFVRGVG